MMGMSQTLPLTKPGTSEQARRHDGVKSSSDEKACS